MRLLLKFKVLTSPAYQLFRWEIGSPGWVGTGISCMIRWAIGFMRSFGTRLPANGERRYCELVADTALVGSNAGLGATVNGSKIVKSLFAEVKVLEKSPTRCSGVGTDPSVGCGCASW